MKKFIVWFIIFSLISIHGGVTALAYGTKYAAEIFTARSVTAGFYNIAAIKNDGSVWAWGFNEKQSISPDASPEISTPVRLDGISDAKTADTDIYNTVVLSRDGKVYVAGDSSYGQTAGKSASGIFTLIDSLNGIVDVQTSSYYIEENGNVYAEPYIMALDANGDVYAWGANKRGMLGVGSDLDIVSVPTRVAYLSDIISISVCGARAAALKSDGTVYCWGYTGTEIYYADDDESKFSAYASRCPSLTDIVSVVAGSHILALDKDGNIYGFGNGDYGQLGASASTEIPTLLEEASQLGVKKICADIGYSAFLCEDGRLFACGNLSQLFGNTPTHSATTLTELTTPSPVTDISLSRSVIVAVSCDGGVYVWGHGGETGVFGTPGSNGLSTSPVRSQMNSVAPNSEYSVSKSESGVILIENARLYSDNGTLLNEMSGSFSGKIYFNTVSGKHATAMAAFAVYENNNGIPKLAAIDCMPITFEGSFEKSFDISVAGFSPEKDYTIRAFVWDMESSLLSPYFAKTFDLG